MTQTVFFFNATVKQKRYCMCLISSLSLFVEKCNAIIFHCIRCVTLQNAALHTMYGATNNVKASKLYKKMGFAKKVSTLET